MGMVLLFAAAAVGIDAGDHNSVSGASVRPNARENECEDEAPNPTLRRVQR
jgi:hypothetical protein